MKLRILIADDHELVRRGLAALLQAHEGWEICAEAKDGREAVEKARQLKPEVVILDVGMPNLNGLAATRQLMQQDSEVKVIVLTITDSDQVIREALDAGARGFVLKSDAARDLVTAVEAVQRNRMFFTPRVNDMVLAGFLDRRENGATTEAPKLPDPTPEFAAPQTSDERIALLQADVEELKDQVTELKTALDEARMSGAYRRPTPKPAKPAEPATGHRPLATTEEV